MREFEIDGVQYRVMPFAKGARDEYSICRRLTGLLKNIDVAAMRSSGENARMTMGLALAAYAGDMPQDDVDFIFDKVLPCVQRNLGGTWSVLAAPNGALMDNTISLSTLVSVMREVMTPVVTDFLRQQMPGLFSSAAAQASNTTP